MNEFKSKLNYDKWLKWKRKYGQLPDLQIPYWEPIVQRALINTVTHGLLGENTSSILRRNGELAVKELLEMVPDGESEVYCSRGWCTSHDRIPASQLAYRLKSGWQPPEEPKELVGWDYIATLGYGTILRLERYRCNLLVGVCGSHFDLCCRVFYDAPDYRMLSYYAESAWQVEEILSLSPSNSTIIWKKDEESQ